MVYFQKTILTNNTQNIVVLLNKRMALRPLQVTEQTVRIKEKCCFNIIAYGQIEP